MGIFGSSAIPEEEPDERGRVFAWARDKRVRMHLAAFFVFSGLIHGAGFYLFKVVYPTPVRVEPRPHGISILDPGDPAVRSVLQRLSDRTVFLLPPSAQSEVRVSLEASRIRFNPAFQKVELEPLPPASLVAGAGMIEPLPLPDKAPPAPATAVGVKLDPALADRPLAPWSILHDYLGLAGSLPLVRLFIEIAPAGSVRVTGVEAALAEDEKRDLAAVVESTLRFVPASASASGWIELGGG